MTTPHPEAVNAADDAFRAIAGLPPKAAIVAYFSFGQEHYHNIDGKIFDKDCIVRIESTDPREVMFSVFGRKWSMQYNELPEMRHFPRGVIAL